MLCKRNFIRLLCPILLVVSTATVFADRIDGLLEQAVEELAGTGEAKVVSVGNFTYADKNMGSSFARYFEEKFAAALAHHPSFEGLSIQQREAQIVEAMISYTIVE